MRSARAGADRSRSRSTYDADGTWPAAYSSGPGGPPSRHRTSRTVGGAGPPAPCTSPWGETRGRAGRVGRVDGGAVPPSQSPDAFYLPLGDDRFASTEH